MIKSAIVRLACDLFDMNKSNAFWSSSFISKCWSHSLVSVWDSSKSESDWAPSASLRLNLRTFLAAKGCSASSIWSWSSHCCWRAWARILALIFSSTYSSSSSRLLFGLASWLHLDLAILRDSIWSPSAIFEPMGSALCRDAPKCILKCFTCYKILDI
ncbi:hypothetical protein BpHYR1_017138 [Brachionus plicatilis]|uniref:Uncharacterized protein n=1 Tax=Brachionus plicatilis TaxID=10195 RepID=A0A3M7S5J0_BRAPC|nr:hypothetical protein BpHYR1_017138 [Brachionus plicatilis]